MHPPPVVAGSYKAPRLQSHLPVLTMCILQTKKMSSRTTRDTVHRELQAGALTNRLLDLYELAAQKEIADKEGRRWVTLTDYEAAKILRCERSSICSCRNRLVEMGAVKEHYHRFCRHRPSQNRVSAWGLASADVTTEMVAQKIVPLRHLEARTKATQTNLFK